jgi:beta-lactam-binding protein with PASTA domain
MVLVLNERAKQYIWKYVYRLAEETNPKWTVIYTSQYITDQYPSEIRVKYTQRDNIKTGFYAFYLIDPQTSNIYGMEFDEAVDLLAKDNVLVVANDTGYNKQMGADCILMQMPGAGTKVKGGRVVYVTINSTSSPKVKIPDIIDNSSYREATARLTAIGFVLNEPEVVDGERDWVYGIKAGFTELHAGDMISIETPLTLVIGNGTSEESGEDAMLDVPDSSEMGEEDDFEEMGGMQ